MGWISLMSKLRKVGCVMDLADRKVVGWALSEIMDAEVTSVAAWKMAVRNRPVSNLCFSTLTGACSLPAALSASNFRAYLLCRA